MLRRSCLQVLTCSIFAAGCGGAGETAPLPRAAPHRAGSVPRKRAMAPERALASYRFAQVSDVIGPYVGRDGELAALAWAEAENGGRTLFASAIAAGGEPSKPVRIASLSGELDLVLVRPFARSDKLPGQPRFAVITTRRDGQKTRIDVTALRADASAAWGPTTIAERGARVLWVGFALSAGSPLLLWAEQPNAARAGEPAALFAQAIALDDKTAPVALAARACVWQVASGSARAALASVKPGPSGCGSGSVTLDLLGRSGKSEKSVDLGGRAALDLDLVATPDAFMLAWSDHEQLEPHAVTAIVDAEGAVRSAPAAAVTALGEQAVVGLIPGPSSAAPAFLVWEDLAERPEGARYFELSQLAGNGRAAGPHTRLFYGKVDGSAPELTAFDGGVAALTLAPACAADDKCEAEPPVPTFVALDAGLKLRASEPLLLDALGGRAADLGWGLSCASSGCFALAAPSRSPAPLFSVPLSPRPSAFRAAALELQPPQKPRVVGSELLMRAPAPLSELSLCAQKGRGLLGYVTDFDPTTPWQKLKKPAEDGRLEPLRARIALRAISDDPVRTPSAEEQVVSLRAHSLGGLTLLPDSAASNAGLALWTGLDKGEPQVFLTLVGADGKRGQQRMLTRKSGAASDVAGLAVDGGFLVAWVDERSGDAEVYAARVGQGLEKTSPEQRITTADGAASELMLTRAFGKPLAIWADARAAEEPGWADIYAAFLRPGDAARDGGEHRLSSTRPHSFAPQVAELGGTSVLAWLEAAADSAPASVRIAELSSSGDLSGNVSVIPIEAGAPRALGLWCSDVSCHVAVTLEAEGRGELYGFEWRPSSSNRPTRLIGLSAPTAAAVAPIIRGGFIYVADLRDGQGLVRRLSVEW